MTPKATRSCLYGSDTQDSLRTDLCFRAWYDIHIGQIGMRPIEGAAWEHEYDSSALPIIACKVWSCYPPGSYATLAAMLFYRCESDNYCAGPPKALVMQTDVMQTDRISVKTMSIRRRQNHTLRPDTDVRYCFRFVRKQLKPNWSGEMDVGQAPPAVARKFN